MSTTARAVSVPHRMPYGRCSAIGAFCRPVRTRSSRRDTAPRTRPRRRGIRKTGGAAGPAWCPRGTGRRTRCRGTPPTATARTPGSPTRGQTGRRVAVQAVPSPPLGEATSDVGEQERVVQGEVHALRGDGRDEVGGVPGQEVAAVGHGFDDVVVHVEHALLDQRALGERRPSARQARRSSDQTRSCGPVLRVVARRALQVVAGDLRGCGPCARRTRADGRRTATQSADGGAWASSASQPMP